MPSSTFATRYDMDTPNSPLQLTGSNYSNFYGNLLLTGTTKSTSFSSSDPTGVLSSFDDGQVDKQHDKSYLNSYYPTFAHAGLSNLGYQSTFKKSAYTSENNGNYQLPSAMTSKNYMSMTYTVNYTYSTDFSGISKDDQLRTFNVNLASLSPFSINENSDIQWDGFTMIVVPFAGSSFYVDGCDTSMTLECSVHDYAAYYYYPKSKGWSNIAIPVMSAPNNGAFNNSVAVYFVFNENLVADGVGDFKNSPTDWCRASTDFNSCMNSIIGKKDVSSSDMSGFDNLSLLFPFAQIFTGFVNPDDECASIPTIATMIHSKDKIVCPFFSSNTRAILTPVITSVGLIIIFGFVIKFLMSGTSLDLGGSGSHVSSDPPLSSGTRDISKRIRH